MRSSLWVPRRHFLDPLVEDLFLPTPGIFVLPGQLFMTLTGTRGGAQLGGGVSGWIHLLPVRSHLVCLLPSGGGRLLLWCCGPHLADARSGGCSRLTLCPAASTNTSSCQQVLRSGGQKHVHRLEWRYPRWRVTWGSYPSRRGAGHGLGGRDHGCVAHHWSCP